ncbi:MAG: TetR/AcrR family transcriptional regulator [Micropepsaceae bacterium]
MSLAPLRSPKDAGKRSRTLDSLLAATQTLLLTRSAASLSIADIAAEAGVVQGTFYNYFENLDALLDEVGAVLLVPLAEGLQAIATSCTSPAETFAAKTRQALRIFAQSPGIGRMLFDIGLPVDRFLRQLHHDIKADILDGIATAEFKSANPELMTSMICGGITGVALDLHRKRLPISAIEPATAELLRQLGVPPAKATRLSNTKLAFAAPLHLPLTWHPPVASTTKPKGKRP